MTSARRPWNRPPGTVDALLFAGFALLLLAVLPPGNVSSDGASMLAVTGALATQHSLSIACSAGAMIGRGGHCYSTYYPLNSFLAVPFFAAGDALGHLGHVSATFVGNAAAQVVPALCAAAAAVLTVTFARRLGASRPQAVIAGVTLVLATEMALLERTFYAEALLTALISLDVWLLHRPWPGRFLVPAAIGLTILAKPQAFLVAPLLAIDLAQRSRSWRPVVLVAVGSAVGAILYGIYDEVRFSSFTNLGGSDRTLHTAALTPLHVIRALGLLTISPGRGLFVFSPICVLGLVVCVRRRREPLARAGLIVLLALLLVYVGNPGTGYEWASRYLGPALPLLVAAAWSTRGTERVLAAILSVLGAVVEFPTFVGFYQRYYAEGVSHHIAPAARYWSVVHTPLLGVWGSVIREVRDASATDLHALVGANPVGESVQDQRFYHVISEWWWMTPVAGVPRLLGALIAAGLAGTGLALLRRWARAHRDDREPTGVRPAAALAD